MKPTVEVVIPVYNEERDLPKCVERLLKFLYERLPNPWRILIADNGSTDRTMQVAEELAQKYELVGYYHL
ncbi:MAG: glycosyltransferase, partial [Chloroflexota bacterium]|nr:glycosyltransferase [Chloroflexota bacterium]